MMLKVLVNELLLENNSGHTDIVHEVYTNMLHNHLLKMMWKCFHSD